MNQWKVMPRGAEVWHIITHPMLNHVYFPKSIQNNLFR